MPTQRGLNTDPFIKWDHVDGPCLVCRDGSLHWLTRVERLWLQLGLTSVEQLDNKYNCEPQRG